MAGDGARAYLDGDSKQRVYHLDARIHSNGQQLLHDLGVFERRLSPGTTGHPRAPARGHRQESTQTDHCGHEDHV